MVSNICIRKLGHANVTNGLLPLIWDKLHANKLEIPYPQMDLHLRSAAARQDAKHFDSDDYEANNSSESKHTSFRSDIQTK